MHRLIRWPVGLAVAPVVALCLAGCTLGAGEAGLPPLTPEPDAPLVAATPAPAGPSYPARLALMRYLRGIATGDPRICVLIGPEFEESAFGAPGGCRTGLAAARRELSAADLAALRTVSVPTATIGPEPAGYTVSFAELGWRGEPARPGGLLADRYVLRRTGSQWIITA
ncbi:hypothetical protein DPM19_15095 [Actinomadura craniellae]|uniref:Uncharacterized protein n=1 Tax=Actinomadura craniellae TaxID=2231787 RepID=A0A365H5H6_9ACTN|nr:hypothetical protein [Actinomadura craniellae]RAY14299.1 hypothetical protein DPM19_15095 [Actinomadura craniellae]